MIHDIVLDFPEYVHGDLPALASDFASWISDPQTQSTDTSRVGIMSTFTFQSIVSSAASEYLSQMLRLLVETSSILHNHHGEASYCGVPVEDLWKLRSFAGVEVLRQLETALTNKHLVKSSLQELQALFLILVGAILAVGYSHKWNNQEFVSCVV